MLKRGARIGCTNLPCSCIVCLLLFIDGDCMIWVTSLIIIPIVLVLFIDYCGISHTDGIRSVFWTLLWLTAFWVPTGYRIWSLLRRCCLTLGWKVHRWKYIIGKLAAGNLLWLFRVCGIIKDKLISRLAVSIFIQDWIARRAMRWLIIDWKWPISRVFLPPIITAFQIRLHLFLIIFSKPNE